MRQLIFSIALVFFSANLFSQSENNKFFLIPQDTIQPFVTYADIPGFEDELIYVSTKGADQFHQIAYRAITNPGGWIRVFDQKGFEIIHYPIHPGYQIELSNRTGHPIGFDTIHFGEGLEQPVLRILHKVRDSTLNTKLSELYEKRASVDSLIAIEESKVEQARQANQVKWLVWLGKLLFILSILYMLWYFFWYRTKDKRKLKRQKKLQLMIDKVKSNLETMPLYKAGPPRVSGGVRLDVAKSYLSGVAKVDPHKILWFLPVNVKFLREVQISFGGRVQVSAQPSKEEKSVYYFGQTTEGLVLCDAQSGNVVTGLYGRPLNFGLDFVVVKPIILPEVTAYRAFEFFSEKFKDKNSGQLALNLKFE